jgi:hypothetical protein
MLFFPFFVIILLYKLAFPRQKAPKPSHQYRRKSHVQPIERERVEGNCPGESLQCAG